MWSALRLIATLIAALLFLLLPMALRDSIPDGLFDAWDTLLAPLRGPITQFWWGYFNRLDQQPLFQLSTLLSQAVIITALVEGVRWLWRRRAA